MFDCKKFSQKSSCFVVYSLDNQYSPPIESVTVTDENMGSPNKILGSQMKIIRSPIKIYVFFDENNRVSNEEIRVSEEMSDGVSRWLSDDG